jgi:hypothetical protein
MRKQITALHLITACAVKWTALLPCNLEALGLSLGYRPAILTGVFHDFLLSIQENAGTVPQN